jgi:hypothetical protein
MEDCFHRAIEHRRRLGPRSTVLGVPVTSPPRARAGITERATK